MHDPKCYHEIRNEALRRKKNTSKPLLNAFKIVKLYTSDWFYTQNGFIRCSFIDNRSNVISCVSFAVYVST